MPVRINGSAIESLFSRFKYNAKGNLSDINYETTMSRLLTASVVDTRNNDTFYRNADVTVQCVLKRKNQGSNMSSCLTCLLFLSTF